MFNQNFMQQDPNLVPEDHVHVEHTRLIQITTRDVAHTTEVRLLNQDFLKMIPKQLSTNHCCGDTSNLLLHLQTRRSFRSGDLSSKMGCAWRHFAARNALLLLCKLMNSCNHYVEFDQIWRSCKSQANARSEIAQQRIMSRFQSISRSLSESGQEKENTRSLFMN